MNPKNKQIQIFNMYLTVAEPARELQCCAVNDRFASLTFLSYPSTEPTAQVWRGPLRVPCTGRWGPTPTHLPVEQLSSLSPGQSHTSHTAVPSQR
jgi:hypothetical protein